jgi:hypothetical protein
MTISCGTVNVSAVGSLKITSYPSGAGIWLAPHGQTPAWLNPAVYTPDPVTNLAVGFYDIKLTKNDYQDYTYGNAEIIANTETQISASLVASTGSVSFTSTPSGAAIYIDDTLQIGITTPSGTISGITPGSHSYMLTKSLYANATGTFSVSVNTNTPVSVTFAGSAYITSTPSGARIWLDDSDTGASTPATITGLAPIYHSYYLVLSGRDNTTGNFTTIAGQTANVPTTLLTPASIVAQGITITPSNPCIEGTCSVAVSTTWINNGQSSGSFVPNIAIDSTPITPIYGSQSIGANGGTVTKAFTVTGLTVAGSPHSICPIPNV